MATISRRHAPPSHASTKSLASSHASTKSLASSHDSTNHANFSAGMQD